MEIEKIKKLTILHSNDMHGDFLSETIDKELFGGISMLSGYVSKTRQECPNSLYLIAGDMFRGSVIDSEYKGISTIDVMNLLGPDVVSLGNHEFDYGISHLVFLEKCAKFPIINSNIYIKTTNTRLFDSHKILKIDGMKIMIIGLITEEIMNNSGTDNLIGTFVNVNEAAEEVGRICNNYKTTDIDFTVLLTHIGFENDKKLAKLLKTEWGVDVIIGGHSHTVLEKPYEDNGIVIVQAGVGTNQIGRFDILVDTKENKISSYEWKLIPITDKYCPRDAGMEQALSKYKEEVDRKYNRILTKFNRILTHPQRNQETEIGNLFSDILKDSLETDIVLVGSGSIRKETFGPLVTYGDLVEIFPYDDEIYRIMVSGKDLFKAFKYLLRDDAFIGETEFYQLSKGLCVTYNKPKKKVESITLNGSEIEKDKLYSLALQNYHFSNLDKFFDLDINEISKNKLPRVISTSACEILEEYLTININIDSKVENRYNIIE